MATVAIPLTLLLILTGLVGSSVQAAGTAAGTAIVTKAHLAYTSGMGTELALDSEPVQTVVAELLEVSVVWQDAAPIPVAPGASLQLLTFALTNTGNGAESYVLALNHALAEDDFDPTAGRVFLDTDGNGRFESASDSEYILGTQTPELPADSRLLAFVLCAIPAGVTDGQTGRTRLEARSATGTGAPGTAFPRLGTADTDAVVGGGGGVGAGVGAYAVWDIAVKAFKTVSVVDPFGGDQAVPGAILTYEITVSIEGSGSVQEAVFSDPIPEYTAYRANTLKLDGRSLTDASDGDVGEVGVSSPDTVLVKLGELTPASAPVTISFEVGIK